MNERIPAKLPKKLAAKASTFPECHMGVNRVNLILGEKKKINEVFLAWGEEIVRIGDREIECIEDLDFGLSEVEDVEPC